MTPSLAEALVTFVLLFLTMILATATAMWADQAGLMGSDDIDSWWGRPIKRSDYEPSETNYGMLLFFAVLFGGYLLSALLVDLLF